MKSLIAALAGLTIVTGAHAASASPDTCDVQSTIAAAMSGGDQPWTIVNTPWYAHACDVAVTN